MVKRTKHTLLEITKIFPRLRKHAISMIFQELSLLKHFTDIKQSEHDLILFVIRHCDDPYIQIEIMAIYSDILRDVSVA